MSRTSNPSVEPMPLAFIGLGVMGYPMAGHLARAGHHVTVYNRTRKKAERWVEEHGGQVADTPAQAAAQARMVFACVGADEDLREVAAGAQGALTAMSPGSIFCDHTTSSAALARELDALAKDRAVHFLDAPVSGGQAGAIAGSLALMCGGEAAAFEQARPVMMAYARSATLLGPCGSGQLTKMVNQICIAGLLQALSEGLAFGQAAGLDMKAVLQVISQGAARSWQMEHRGQTMVDDEFDFGFAVEWMRKDLGLCLDEARRNGARLPVTALVDQFYADLCQRGGQRWDTSSLIRRLK